jgi:tetratricopeptide (TPR) repeat protein
MADMFISYTGEDRNWAFWIAHELQALGHVPHVHDWEISGGGDIMGWMEERHRAADHVLCIVSNAYLQKPYSSLERRVAQRSAVSERPGYLLPVFVEHCSTPSLFSHLKRCDLYGLTEEDARARLQAFVSRASRPTQSPAFPGSANASLDQQSASKVGKFPGRTAVSNVPINVPLHFMGGDDALAEIESHEGRVAITALHGLRGVGKTTLAAAYAERHSANYRATWWIRAETEPRMRADLVALGIRLGWVGADEEEGPAVEAVMERLRHEGEGILLIFDNAVDAKALNRYLPGGGGVRALITSNAFAWREVAAPVEIRVWSTEIGADYLIARTGREAERAAAQALSHALGGLPLAHEQAAAFCERLDISLADYRKRFETAPGQYLGDARYAPAEYHDGLTVAKTFGLAIDEAAKLHPAAEPLIVHAALLAQEPIPLFLFAEAREKFGEPLASMLAGEGLDEAVAALRAFALVNREVIVDERDASITTDAIRLHRLVREMAAARCEGDARASLRRALVAALAAVYPDEADINRSSWSRCGALTAHLLVNCETEMVEGATNVQCAELLDRAGSYFYSRGAYSRARPLFERALAIYEKVLGPKHPDTATGLSYLAYLLQAQGELLSARPLFERALAIREEVLGPEHHYTATSLNNLATLLHDQGDLAEARPLFERALAIYEKVLGPEHPDTATTLNNLATLLHDQGDLKEAQPLHERALAIYEKVLGPEHPDTASSLNDLARVLQTQGDLVGARPLFERALAIREKVLGPEHPDTASSLNNLATLLHDQGDLKEAQPLHERALAIYEKVLGREHPATATGLSYLARLLQAQGDLVGARPLFERALAIREKVLGPEHPDTTTSLSNLASLLQAQGDLAGARILFERAFAVSERVNGPDHPETMANLQKLMPLLEVHGDNAARWPERLSAIERLTKFSRDDITRDILFKAIVNEPEEKIRCSIVTQLAELWPDEKTRDFLLDITKRDTSPEVRATGCEYLSQLWWKQVGVRQWLRSLAAAATTEDIQPRLLHAVELAGGRVSAFWERRFLRERGADAEPEMLPGYPAFRISQFRLRDIGPIRDTGIVELGKGVNIFLGDNAAGKTTILRSLGLAAIGLAAANEVEDNAAGYLRKGASRGTIEVLFELVPDPDAALTESGYFATGLQIVAGSSRFTSIPDSDMSLLHPEQSSRQLLNSTEPLALLRSDSTSPFGFVSGYGAVRTFSENRFFLQAETQKSENEWVLSLYRPDAWLVNPEIFAKFIRGDTSNIEGAPLGGLSVDLINALRTSIKHLFPEVSVFLSEGDDDLQINSTALRFGDLSEGYRSLFALLGHLLRCSLKVRDWKHDPTQIDGIALIDEIDLHLHPAWQSHVVQDFRKAFRNVQLVASTHSPLVVGALKREDVLILSRGTDGCMTVHRPELHPQGLGVAGILTNIFDLGSTIDQPTLDKIARRLLLYSEREKWNDRDKQEYAELTDHLADLGFGREFSDPYFERFATAMAKRHKVTTRKLTVKERRELDEYADQLLSDIMKADDDDPH